tara:strand:- start:78 stop:929 length:852 start_codon:yes stop_codon:yes gene_type:complete
MKIGLINIALELFNNKKFKSLNNMLDMGSKELRVSYNQLKFAFDQTQIKFNKKKFEKLKIFPKGKRISTKNFWQEVGVKNYKCSDINKSHDSVYIDLNKPLTNKKLLQKFDLVTDFGNNEHVFNIGEAYRTMYNLTKKNGLIWIFQSVYGGNGFFNFDASFFEGYAAANNLSIVHACYLVYPSEYEQIVVPCNKDLFNVLDLTKVKGVDISYVFRKKSDKEFSYNYQYGLNNNQSKYLISFLNSEYPPEKLYIPTKSITKLKQKAKKGDKISIEWLRATGIKY